MPDSAAIVKGRARFGVLDGWRGIAATMVALHHLPLASHIGETGFVRHSSLFVDFFFVLSGFVISHAYFDGLRSKSDVGVFLLRRFGRLWPLHVTVLSILVLLELAKFFLIRAHAIPFQPVFDSRAGTSIGQLITSLFLVQAVGIDTATQWNGPSWSISTEFWAYALFACLCVSFNRRTITAIAAAIALGAAVMVAVTSTTYLDSTFAFGLLRCLYGFFVGHIIYRLRSALAWSIKFPHVSELGTVALLVIYVSLTYTAPANPWTMAAPLVFAVPVFVFAFEAGFVSALMRNPVCLSLGAWSYSIYMIHERFAFILRKVVIGCEHAALTGQGAALYRGTCLWVLPPYSLSYLGNAWVLDVVELAYIGIVVGLASLTFRFVEQPGRRYFNHLAHDWPKSAAKAAKIVE